MPRHFWPAALCMAIIVLASNVLVNYPINDWLVWGAITYPFAFLVTDVVNRRHGAPAARRVVWVGFAFGVAASLFVGPRVALASGTAFLAAQLLDVQVFDALRRRARVPATEGVSGDATRAAGHGGTIEPRWWVAPVFSTALGAVLDTALFFSIAFAGSGLPWTQWALGDLLVKWVVALVALLPYRLLIGRDALSYPRTT